MKKVGFDCNIKTSQTKRNLKLPKKQAGQPSGCLSNLWSVPHLHSTLAFAARLTLQMLISLSCFFSELKTSCKLVIMIYLLPILADVFASAVFYIDTNSATFDPPVKRDLRCAGVAFLL